MRAHQLVAAAIVCLACALLSAACAEGPTAAPETDIEGSGPDIHADPVGEALQPAYEDVFHIVVIVKDDGKDEAGGWQEARATLKFSDWRKPFAPYFWRCPMIVEMPLRTKLRGRISPEYAARRAAEVATLATESLMHSRDWRGQDAQYCQELCRDMQRMLNAPQPMGARVRHP